MEADTTLNDRKSDGTALQEGRPQDLQIFTDASFDPVRNECGWAFVVTNGTCEIASDCGKDVVKSNNAAEALALLHALEWLGLQSRNEVKIWSDSSHVVEACNRWRHIWRTNGWRRIDPNPSAKKRRIADWEVWQAIDNHLSNNSLIEVVWCKGHAGNTHNERADSLATTARLTIF